MSFGLSIGTGEGGGAAGGSAVAGLAAYQAAYPPNHNKKHPTHRSDANNGLAPGAGIAGVGAFASTTPFNALSIGGATVACLLKAGEIHVGTQIQTLCDGMVIDRYPLFSAAADPIMAAILPVTPAWVDNSADAAGTWEGTFTGQTSNANRCMFLNDVFFGRAMTEADCGRDVLGIVPTTFTATTTNASTTVTITAGATVTSAWIGAQFIATAGGIAAGVTITAVNTGANSFTISSNATTGNGAGAGVSLTAQTWTNVAATTGHNNPLVYQRKVAVTSGGGQYKYTSFNSGAPTAPSADLYALAADKNWFSSRTGTAMTLWVYSTGGDPANGTYSAMSTSAGWHSSYSAGTVTLRVFSPNGSPSALGLTVWVSKQATNGIDINHNNVQIRNVRIYGKDTGLTFNDDKSGATLTNLNIWGQHSGMSVSVRAHKVSWINCNLYGSGDATTGQNWHLIKLGGTNAPIMYGWRFVGCNFRFSGEDGMQIQLPDGSSVTWDSCTSGDHTENPLDMKNSSSFRGTHCDFYCGQYGGTDAVTVQADAHADFYDCTFRALSGYAFKNAPRTGGRVIRCSIFSSNENSLGCFDTSTTTSSQQDGSWYYECCTITTTNTAASAICVELTGADHTFVHCSIHARSTASTVNAINITPATAVTKMAVVLKNCIVQTDGSSTNSYLVNRNAAAASTGITFSATNCLWLVKGTTTTNWMREKSDSPAFLTQAQVDAGSVLAYFAVSSTMADSTQAPLWTNPSKGMDRSSSFNVVGGDKTIGGTLYRIPISSTRAFTAGETVTSSGVGTAYVREVWTDALLVSELTGTFANTNTLTGSKGGLATQSGAISAALTLKALAWSAQSANFTTLGQLVTGLSSTHTGYLVYQLDAGSTGVAVLAVAASQTFANAETATGATEGSITVSGTAYSPARRAVASVLPGPQSDMAGASFEGAAVAASTSFAFSGGAGTARVWASQSSVTATGGNTLSVATVGGKTRITKQSGNFSTNATTGFVVGKRVTFFAMDAGLDGNIYTIGAISGTTLDLTVDTGITVVGDTNGSIICLGDGDWTTKGLTVGDQGYLVVFGANAVGPWTLSAIQAEYITLTANLTADSMANTSALWSRAGPVSIGAFKAAA